MAESLTRDIALPNQSGQIDPRLQTRAAQLDRQRAKSGREPAAPKAPVGQRTGGVRDAVRSAVTNFRTFTGGRR